MNKPTANSKGEWNIEELIMGFQNEMFRPEFINDWD